MAKPDPKVPVLTQDEKDLRRFRQAFLTDYRHEAKFRDEARIAGEFYDGHQWTEDEKQTLRDRGQPDVTINKTKDRIDAIFGVQEGLRVNTKAYPTSDSEEEVEVVSEKLRAIEDDNDFDDLENEAFKGAIIEGCAWYEIKKEWDGLSRKQKIGQVDYREVVVDMHSKEKDLCDAKHIHRHRLTEIEDAIALFPDNEEEIRACVDGYKMLGGTDGEISLQLPGDQYKSGQALEYQDFNDFVDRERQQVRLVTTFYRKLVPERFFFSPGEDPMDVTTMDKKSLETLQLAKPNGMVETQLKKTLNSITYCWNVVLEHKKDIRKHDPYAKFNLIPVWGYRERKEKRPYGLTRQIMDPQKEVNKRRSKLLHLLNVNRVRFEEGAFENEDEARKQFVRPDGWIKQRKEFQVNVDNNLDISMAHFQLLQLATRELDGSAAGPAVEGEAGATSGRDRQLRQQQVIQPIRELFTNLRKARRALGYYLMDDILLDNPELQGAKYKIKIEEAPESLNLNQETFETLASLAKDPRIAAVMPVDLLIKVSPLSGNVKKEFIERVQQAQMQQQQMQMAMAQAQMQGQAPQGPPRQ